MKQYSSFYYCALSLLLIVGLYSTGRAVTQNAALFSLLLNVRSEEMIPSEPSENHNHISPTQTTQHTVPEPEPEAVISFSAEDLDLFGFHDQSGQHPDLEQLLSAPLKWRLNDGRVRVLIVHTHTTESYTGNYEPVEPYRSLEETQNMLAIGDELARVLELGGIQVIHDRTIHDYPDYSGAYQRTRQTIAARLEEYPTVCMVLDLHRDAAAGDDYGALVTQATVGGQSSAQLMFVAGSGFDGWQHNLSLALKLSAQLEREDPGITRPVSLRAKQYNLDLNPGSLLVEVGAAGNTRQEAIIAANALGRAIVELANGSD